MTQELRRYNFTKEEVNRKIEHYPILNSRRRNNLKEPILTRSIFGQLDYKRCVRYAEEDYDACEDQARQLERLPILGLLQREPPGP